MNRKETNRKYYLKNREKICAYSKEWVKNNREKRRATAKKYRAAQKEKWIKIISDKFGDIKCKRCGYDECFAALDFHHKNPDEKDFGWAYRILYKPTPELIAELDKCEILCSNCHRKLHWELRNE